MLTHQQIFDKSVSGVLAQGRPSMASAICVYAGPNNTACGVGQLLPREVAEKWDACCVFSVSALRGIPAGAEERRWARKAKADLRAAGIPTDLRTMNLLEDLQSAHDCPGKYNFLDNYKLYANSIANRYNLSTAVLES